MLAEIMLSQTYQAKLFHMKHHALVYRGHFVILATCLLINWHDA